MSTLSWGDIGKNNPVKNYSGSSSGSDLFVKTPEGKHQIRLVGKPVQINVAWIQNDEGRNEKFIVPPTGSYEQRLKNLNIDVRPSFAANCFVRGDEECRLRILEKGKSIFNSFSTYYEEFAYTSGPKKGQHIDPGGPDGPDFRIIAKPPSGKGGQKRISYEVIPLQATPFTKEEKELLARTKDPDNEEIKALPLGQRGIIDLEKFYDMEKSAEKLDKRLAELAGIKVSDAEDVDVNESQTKTAEASIDDVIGSDDDEDSYEGDDSTSDEVDEVLDDLF